VELDGINLKKPCETFISQGFFITYHRLTLIFQLIKHLFYFSNLSGRQLVWNIFSNCNLNFCLGVMGIFIVF
jgi:hypothetical protein